MRLLSAFCCSAAISILCPAAAYAADTPEGLLVEAEAVEGASVYANIVDLTEASGGQAVTSPKDWHPLFRYNLEPDDLPQRVTIHVRRQHGPVQLKARVDGKTKEIKWLWGKPGQLEWASFGTFDLTELGDRIEIIRGSGDKDPVVDAVVFADADAGNAVPKANANTPQNAGDVGITGGAAAGSSSLPPERPNASLPVNPVDVSVDWSATVGQIDAGHWGVAAYSMVNAEEANEPGYVAFLSTLQPGLVRVHHAGMPNKWSDETTRSWDVAAIRNSLAPMAQLPDAELMVTLCGWPTWFSESKAVAPEQYDEAEELVRQWVRAVREASPVPVTHFEIFNEFDNTWEKAGRADELWPLFVRMVNAAREEASGAKVGGPALTWAKPEWVRGILNSSGDQIDFISWHGYAGGKPTTPNDKVLDRVNAFAQQAQFVKQELATRGLGHVETYLNEYNVQWTWQPYERRHANAIGAALQASIIARLARQDVTGLTVWHAKGNAYGLIDKDNRLRAPGQLFLLGRHHLVGDVATTSDFADDVLLDVLPVTDAQGKRSVMLVNRNEAAVYLGDAMAMLGRIEPGNTASATLHRIDADGWTTLPTTHPTAATLPGWSVTIITEHPSPGRFGTITLPGQHRAFDF